MDTDHLEKPSSRRSLWLGLLAGLVLLLVGGVAHEMLFIALKLPAPEPWLRQGHRAWLEADENATLWLALQVMDVICAALAGVVVARWSPRQSWKAAMALLLLVLGYTLFAQFPSTKSGWRLAVWCLSSPLGLLCGAVFYRWRERGRPEPVDGGWPFWADSFRPVNLVLTAPPVTLAEALGIITICFGYAIFSSVLSLTDAAGVLPFTDGAFAGLVLMELVLACVALAVLAARRYPLRSLVPRPSWRDGVIGVGLYVVATVACLLVTMPFDSEASSQPISQLLAQSQVTLAGAIPMALVNGTYEEVFLLGLLLRGLLRFGRSNALGISLLVRMLYHIYQGPVGVLSIAVVGLVLSLFYLRTGRLFPVVVAHVIADVVPFLGHS
jgi:membrane protease YdiL (CAAX protease family)